jgi:hypothetical protein
MYVAALIFCPDITVPLVAVRLVGPRWGHSVPPCCLARRASTPERGNSKRLSRAKGLPCGLPVPLARVPPGALSVASALLRPPLRWVVAPSYGKGQGRATRGPQERGPLPAAPLLPGGGSPPRRGPYGPTLAPSCGGGCRSVAPLRRSGCASRAPAAR